MLMHQVQQNLNQIMQICNQLSQNEQNNASRLNQMIEAERAASQQLQQCIQLCQQVSQQMSQMGGQMGGQIGTQMGGQFGQVSFQPQQQFTSPTSYGMSQPYQAAQPSITSQYGASTRYESAKEFMAGHPTYNTNKDLGK